MEDQVKYQFILQSRVNLEPSYHILGAGKSATIRAISLHAEKLLRQAGHDPNHPVILIAAPTGKAASLISELMMGNLNVQNNQVSIF